MTFREFLHKDFWLVLTLIFLTVMAVLSVITAGLVVAGQPLKVNPAPFTYLDEGVTNSPVCSGGMLRFTVKFSLDGPDVVAYVDTVWDVQEQTTVVFDTAPNRAVYVEPETVIRTRTFQLPSLAPGKYELREGAQDFVSAPRVARMPFEVKACP